MFSRANIIATLVGFFILFILGWVFYGILAADFFEAQSTNNVMKDPPEMALIALSCLIQGFVLSTLYGKFAGGEHSFGKGFGLGAWIGAFLGFGVGLMWYATSDLMTFTGSITDMVWLVVEYGFTVGIIATIYKALDK